MTNDEELSIIRKWQNNLTGGEHVDDRMVRHVVNYSYFLMIHHKMSEAEAIKVAAMVCSGMPPCCESATNWEAMYELLSGAEKFMRSDIVGMLYDELHKTKCKRLDGDVEDFIVVLAGCVNDDACAEYVFSTSMKSNILHDRYFLQALRKLQADGLYNKVTATIAVYLVYGADVALSVMNTKNVTVDRVVSAMQKNYI